MTYNILFAGVGGTGAILTSVIVARAAHFDGYKVKGAQLHGLSQRGGAIPVQVRFGKKNVHSPVIPKGQADLIIGLELTEALRYFDFADKKRTAFIINTYPIKPVMLKKEYPSKEWVEKQAAPFAKKKFFVDAGEICKSQFNNTVFGNVMILGAAWKEKVLPISKKALVKALKVTAPREIENNLEAFRLGLEWDGQ